MSACLPVVILLSGRGSNMQVLAEHARDHRLPIDIRAVISDKPHAGGISIANDFGIPTEVLAPRDYTNRDAFDFALAQRVQSYNPALVILAGYMRILNTAFVRQFKGRLINIHPSLLPKYPGLHTHRRALESGDKIHGATVHFVTEDLDAGPLLIQGQVPIWPGDDETTLSARVQQIEHTIYPQAVDWFAKGRVAMRDGQAWLDGKPLNKPQTIEVTPCAH
jgi:phosphoribosylglycinamide formyltransferase-1